MISCFVGEHADALSNNAEVNRTSVKSKAIFFMEPPFCVYDFIQIATAVRRIDP